MNISWVAGFFDGEGCISCRIKENTASQPRITITQFGEEGYLTLVELQKIVGFGHICRSGKGYNQWRVTNNLDCVNFCKKIFPYTIRKKNVVGLFLSFLILNHGKEKKRIGLAILKTHGRKGKRR